MIPLDGGVMIATLSNSTIVIATQNKTIIEYYVDFQSNDYVLNNELAFN